MMLTESPMIPQMAMSEMRSSHVTPATSGMIASTAISTATAPARAINPPASMRAFRPRMRAGMERATATV